MRVHTVVCHDMQFRIKWYCSHHTSYAILTLMFSLAALCRSSPLAHWLALGLRIILQQDPVHFHFNNAAYVVIDCSFVCECMLCMCGVTHWGSLTPMPHIMLYASSITYIHSMQVI